MTLLLLLLSAWFTLWRILVVDTKQNKSIGFHTETFRRHTINTGKKVILYLRSKNINVELKLHKTMRTLYFLKDKGFIGRFYPSGLPYGFIDVNS